MKNYLTIFRKKIILISLLIVIRQLFLVLAQRLNAEIFEGLVEMDFNFFYVYFNSYDCDMGYRDIVRCHKQSI